MNIKTVQKTYGRGRLARRKRGKANSSKTNRISYLQAGRQLLGDVAWLKSQINAEDKYVDTSGAGTLAAQNTFVLLNGLSLGTTATSREGVSVKFNSLEMDFNLNEGASSLTYGRVMIVQDHAPNTAIFSITDLFTAAVVGSDYTVSKRNVAYMDRFVVLYDYAFILDTYHATLRLAAKEKLGFHTKYNTGNAGTVADIGENSVYLLMLTNQAANFMAANYIVRMRFLDN